MLKLVDYQKPQSGEYAAHLADFGDPALDDLYAQSKEKPTRVCAIKEPLPERCPGCGETKLLQRGHYATVCKECHNSISELAARRFW